MTTSTIDRISPISTRPFFQGRLILPPGINHSYRPIMRGIVGTPELSQFKQDASILLKFCDTDKDILHAVQAAKRQRVPLALRLDFYFPYRWKSDIDGPIKAVQDSICTHLQLNDNLIVRLEVNKYADKSDPHVEFSLCCVIEQAGSGERGAA